MTRRFQMSYPPCQACLPGQAGFPPHLGLRLTGFPGVLGRAGLDGRVTQDEIRQLLKTCQEQGTPYSATLIETVAQMCQR